MADAEMPAASGDPLVGRVVHDRYRILRTIGKGGMGVVYEARHLLTERIVALKVLSAHAALSPSSVQRFQREAQAAASIGNSHVVDVLDMGQLDAGSFYIVHEHLNGMDLGFAVALANPFPLSRAIDVTVQLCDALSAVHAAGIVHRDLKPENVFLIQRDGQPDFVKVLDFGICKATGLEAGRLTETGDTLGTPQFMAPEQVEGRRDLDHRTDIHAIGVLLYFLLTGHAPFEGVALPKLLLKICHDPMPDPRAERPDLPPELVEILTRTLHKNPEHRYESCAELKSALLLLGRQRESFSTLVSADAGRYSAADTPASEVPLVVPVRRFHVSSRTVLGATFATLLVGSVIVYASLQRPVEREPSSVATEPIDAQQVERPTPTNTPVVVPPTLVPVAVPSVAPVVSGRQTSSRALPREAPKAPATQPAVESSSASAPTPPSAPAPSATAPRRAAPAAAASENSQDLLLNHGLKRGL